MIIKGMPVFGEKSESIDWIIEHMDDILYEAKTIVKHADALNIGVVQSVVDDNLKVIGEKAAVDGGAIVPNMAGEIKARLIINTTNFLDSHKDVHIPGIWKKSLQENKRIKHKQEHGYRFKDIIADKEDLDAFTKKYKWRDLGYDMPGETEALVFDSTIKRSRNEEMFEEYKEGNVDNHSVGMQYVKMFFAANTEEPDQAQYKEQWDKYFPTIANKEDAERSGYFWAVTEAKAREGSAVPDGSNPITPTLSRKTHLEQKPEKAEKSLSMERRGILNFLKTNY